MNKNTILKMNESLMNDPTMAIMAITFYKQMIKQYQQLVSFKLRPFSQNDYGYGDTAKEHFESLCAYQDLVILVSRNVH